MWQSVFEQFFAWIPLLLAYYLLYKAIATKPKQKTQIINERKLLVPTILLIFVSGISCGIHICAQIIEDTLKGTPHTFLYNLTYFLDEFPGHLYLVFLLFIGFFLIIMEFNRKDKQLTYVENILLTIMALFNGFMWGVTGVEGGSMYLLIIPLTTIFAFYLGKTIRRYELDTNELPYTKYFLITAN